MWNVTRAGEGRVGSYPGVPINVNMYMYMIK